MIFAGKGKSKAIVDVEAEVKDADWGPATHAFLWCGNNPLKQFKKSKVDNIFIWLRQLIFYFFYLNGGNHFRAIEEP